MMGLLLLVIPSRNATNSAGPGARQSTTDSTQCVGHQLKHIYIAYYTSKSGIWLVIS